MLARDIRVGDQILVEGTYHPVVSVETGTSPITGRDRIFVVSDLSKVAPRDPRTGEKRDWTRYESWFTPSASVRARRVTDDAATLRAILRGNAFPAEVEDDLEERGLIQQADQPYALLTDAGRALLKEKS